MAEAIRFTKKQLDKLPAAPEGKRIMYADASLPGLFIRLSPTGRKTFVVYAKPKGQPRPVKVTLGTFPNMTIEQAQRIAKSELSKLAEGRNPNAENKIAKAANITLDEVFQDYLRARKNLKPNTINDYRKIMRQMFEDWKSLPMSSINRDMVATRHAKYGERSPARANNGMRVLRALFNFATGEYENEAGHSLFPDNPVTRISHTRAWYHVERRRSVIKTHELEPWFKTVLSMKNAEPNEMAETYRDYFLTVLLTGLRRDEAAKLTLDDLDFKAKTLTVHDTKNREPHTLPMPDFLFELLSNRASLSSNNFVFDSPTSRTGHIVAVQKQVENIRKASGVNFTMHDLRRTFLTTAESLDISAFAVKRLANHKMRADVTAGYIVTDVERLRKPMQEITDYFLKAAKIKPSSEIISINSNVN